jgi:GNAT superfamily N-acetyltransferase
MDTYRVVKVTPDSPKSLRSRAQRVGRLANAELQYDFGVYDPDDEDPVRWPHAFLAFEGDEDIGILVAERRGEAIWKFTWAEYGTGTPPPREASCPGYWSVVTIWVRPARRRMGIGRLLVETAAQEFCLDAARLGWYTPFTVDGERLVRYFCPDWFLIVK